MFEPDDPLISALIDDELDPESRRRVEQAIRSDPRAARVARELAAVSIALSGLPRPSETPDVSEAVLGQIERNARARRRAFPTFTAAAVLAAAATLIATILVNRLVFDRGGPPLQVVDNVPTATTDAAQEPAGPSDPGIALVGNTPADLTPEVAIDPAGPRLSDRDAGRLRFVLDLIEHPEARQWEIAGAEPLDRLADQVDDVLRTIVRDDPRYGRFRLDEPPSGADGGSRRAIGFAFVARPPEIRYLLDQLEQAVGLRPSAMEAGMPPGVRPPLDAIASWDLRDAERAAPLLEVPAPHIAYKSDPHGDYDLLTPDPNPSGRPSNPPGVHPPRTRPGVSHAPASVENAPRAVFVWVRSDPDTQGSN